MRASSKIGGFGNYFSSNANKVQAREPAPSVAWDQKSSWDYGADAAFGILFWKLGVILFVNCSRISPGYNHTSGNGVKSYCPKVLKKS
jgi:hypothetical protein